MINTRNICSLRRLNVPSTQKNFRVLPNQHVVDIRGLRFLQSNVEVLTSDVCDALSFVVCFDTRRLGLVDIEEDAFVNCARLEQVDLSRNALTKIPSRLFDWNEKLKVVFLEYNHLTEIDENLFQYNENLMYLNLNNNRLQSLHPRMFDYNPKLTYLRLGNNRLRDVSFLYQIPAVLHLKWIHLENNQLSVREAENEAAHLREKFPNLHEIRI